MLEPGTVHASCVAVAEGGVLITGPSGAGKSTLARQLVAAARREGVFARLVGDDRIRIEERHGRVVARSVEAVRGLVEVRGVGLLPVPAEEGAVVRLVVELSAHAPRLPEDGEATIALCGVGIPRFFARRGAPLADLVLDRMRCAGDTVVTAR
jgi:HPr kinase/phosphorylase